MHRCKRAKLAEPIARGGTAHRASFCRRRLASAAMSTHTQYNITHLVCGGAMCRKAGVGGGERVFSHSRLCFFRSQKLNPPLPLVFSLLSPAPSPPPTTTLHAIASRPTIIPARRAGRPCAVGPLGATAVPSEVRRETRRASPVCAALQVESVRQGTRNRARGRGRGGGGGERAREAWGRKF